MLLKLASILAFCALAQAHFDEESVALPGLGLGLLGLKAKADAHKFKAGVGLAALGIKGAKKAFHAGALLGAANPNEFGEDDEDDFAEAYGANAVGAVGAEQFGFKSAGAEGFYGAQGAEQFGADSAYGAHGSSFKDSGFDAAGAYGAQGAESAYGAYGAQGASSFKDSGFESFGAESAYGAYGAQGAESAYGAYGAHGVSSFKDSSVDAFAADAAYGANSFKESQFDAAQGAYGAYGAEQVQDFVAQPQEFGAEGNEEEDPNSQFRFGKKKKFFVLVKEKDEDHDEKHEHKHEGKHVHKHQHLHYDNYDVHHHGGYGGGHGGYGHGGYGHGGYGGGHGGYGHGGYGHGGYGHGGYGHGGYGHGGYGHGGYKHKRDTCGYTHLLNGLTDTSYTTPYEAAVYDVNGLYTTGTNYYGLEPFFTNEHVNSQQTTSAAGSSNTNSRSSRCLGTLGLDLMDFVASTKNIHADDDEGVALSRSKRDTRQKRTLSKLFDGHDVPDITSILPEKGKPTKKKTNHKKTTSEALLPPMTPEQKQQFAFLHEHFDLHRPESNEEEQYSSKPKTSRQNQSHLRPFKNFQVNLFDTTPFHKRKNPLLDDTRQKLGPAGNSHLPVPIQPAHLIPPPPKHSSPTVHDLIDQHATHPVSVHDGISSDHSGKKVPCPCANGKCELGCECAEPYKQALWNFVQCMQGCIESVLTEIDRIRVSDSLNHGSDNMHSAGKFPRSSSMSDRKKLEELRKMVEEYRDKLSELEFVTKDGFHVHSTYLEDTTQPSASQKSKVILLNDQYSKYQTRSSESSSEENDISGFTEEQIKSILNRFLQHYVNLEQSYRAYKTQFLENTEQGETEESTSGEGSGENFEEDNGVQTVLLSELDNIRPCDFQSFLKIVFEKLLQQKLTYAQLRDLCLNDIKKCIDARASNSL